MFSIDDVIQQINILGPSCYLAKLDLADAFKHITVRSEDWPLLGSTWCAYVPETNCYESHYYLDCVLMFGGRSSPRLFNDAEKAAAFVMKDHGVSYCNQYLHPPSQAVGAAHGC